MAKSRSTISAIFPSREILLQCGLKAKIFPLGLVHLQKFSAAIASTVTTVAQTIKIAPDASADSKKIGEQVLTAVLPYITSDLFDLLRECVEITNPDPNGEQITLADLPHWELPAIINAWFEESFGVEEKWRPWMTAFLRMKDLIKLPSIPPTPMKAS